MRVWTCVWYEWCVSGSEKNCVGDMEALGIYESLQLKRQVLLSASEAAELIALTAGDVELLAVAVAELRAVDAAARRAVVAGGDDLVVLDDDRAVFAPQTGRAVEHRVGNVEIVFVLAHALIHVGRASFV